MAAGRGTRMGSLCDDCPKPMLPLLGVPKLEHTFAVLPGVVSEVIFIVGYLQDQIRDHFGGEYSSLPITYIAQECLDGTGGAVALAKDLVGEERFLVLNGDDIYKKSDLEEMVRYPFAVLGQETDDVSRSAALVFDAEGVLEKIEEVPHKRTGSGIVNTGTYVLSPPYFDYPPIPKAPGSDEYGLPQTLMSVPDIDIKVISTTSWYPVGTPEELVEAERVMKSTLEI